MKCKLTKLTFREGKGIKAHIIPRCFYNIDRANKISLEIVNSNEKIYSKRSQPCIYDSNSIKSVEVYQLSITTDLNGMPLATASAISSLARSSLDLKFCGLGVVIGR